MTCEQKGCDKDAVAEVFWPGKTTLSCEEHAESLLRLGDFMGLTVSRRPLPNSTEGK